MPRKKGIGKALKNAVTDGEIKVPFEKKPREIVMANVQRYRIFQFLCIKPCSHLREISRELNKSPPSISWHLQKLVDANYVSVTEFGGKKVYYPKYMIDEEKIEIFVCLNRKDVEKFITIVSKNPGITMYEYEAIGNKKIPGRIIRECMKRGLIYAVKDGKYNRYYIGKWSDDDESSKRMKFFTNYIVEKLVEEGIEASVERKTGGEWIIRFDVGTSHRALVIPSKPLQRFRLFRDYYSLST